MDYLGVVVLKPVPFVKPVIFYMFYYFKKHVLGFLVNVFLNLWQQSIPLTSLQSNIAETQTMTNILKQYSTTQPGVVPKLVATFRWRASSGLWSRDVEHVTKRSGQELH